MSTATASSLQLPDGYVAIERIGSGGYGEVWRATAPGGMEKAVKLVFGQCEDELAEREMKSLERIRDVRHPFVLSLERFDVVGGRLVIVTELADMSLDDCFRKYVADGEPGIPRDELIVYMKDAAEALDCLVDRHSLQHLDIKPENLLVVGEHVKVGDFGLVKELATRTLNSMMGGMTPLYSAPEVFDDAPSPRSDQYSLAIVYQHMLTGKPPFPGRTPAQLAKQHTQAEPILQGLSDGDRQVIRKALAKRPEQRFASCREFVAALAAGGVQPPKPTATNNPARPSVEVQHKDDDTQSSAASLTQAVAQSPDAAAKPQPRVAPTDSQPLHFPAVSAVVEDMAFPEVDLSTAATTPTLFVGVGGLGMKLLNSVRGKVLESQDGETCRSHVGWLAIDTDREALKEAASQLKEDLLHSDEMLHIPLRRPKEYGDRSRQMLSWVSRRWLYNIPRSLETRGYRPLGRIAAVDHAESILSSLYTKLYQMVESNPGVTTLRVVVLACTSGGTGGGTLIDIGQAAQSLAADLNVSIEVDAMLAMPERTAGTTESLAIANTYALLTELAHAQRHGNASLNPPSGPAARYQAAGEPFDTVCWLPIPPRNQTTDHAQTFASIAETLAFEACVPEAAQSLKVCRGNRTGADFRLQSFAATLIGPSDSAADIVGRTKPDLSGYAYQRRRLAIGLSIETVADVLRSDLPTLGTCEASSARAVLVTMASGIDPLHIAANLAEFYPDIAEAASRLHARDDIEWSDLRSEVGAAANSTSGVDNVAP